jgi:hypothetical protein
MCNQKKLVAFVSSTLPISYLIQKKNYNKIIIECEDNVYNSFVLMKLDEKYVKINKIPNQKIRKFFYIINIIKKSEEILIFHECCWVILDLIILLLKPKVIYKPIVTLDNFTKLSSAENKINSWFCYFKSEKIINRLLKTLLKLILSYWFDYYKYMNDGGKEYARISVLKDEFKLDWIKSSPYLSENKRNENKNIEIINNKNILILTALEPINNEIQKTVYKKIIDYFIENNYKVYLKDHPRYNNRLNLEYYNINIINPEIPSEIFDNKYSYVIGAFSTSLVLVRGQYGTISIANLLNLKNNIYNERVSHLKALKGFEEIKFINKIQDLKFIINIY